MGGDLYGNIFDSWKKWLLLYLSVMVLNGGGRVYNILVHAKESVANQSKVNQIIKSLCEPT